MPMVPGELDIAALLLWVGADRALRDVCILYPLPATADRPADEGGEEEGEGCLLLPEVMFGLLYVLLL